MWDRIEHDLVERVVTEDTTPCVTLGLALLVGPVDGYPVAPRLARDIAGRDRILTTSEALRAAVEAKDAAVEAEVAARRSAEARVAQLEKELATRDGPPSGTSREE